MKNSEYIKNKKKPLWIVFTYNLILLSFAFQILYTPLYAINSPNFILNNYYKNINSIKQQLSNVNITNLNENYQSPEIVDENIDEKANHNEENQSIKTIQKYQNENERIDVQVLLADLNNGYIGDSNNTLIDDPKDNLFKINLDNESEVKTAFLVYDVKGISNASGVVKSINEQTSQGGFFVTENKEWITIKEQISVKNLKKGTNTILFTTPFLESISYQVRNVRFEISNKSFDEISLQNDNGIFLVNENKTYIKGNIPNNFNIKEAYANNQKINLYKNEFEGVINFDSNNFKDVSLMLIDESGNIIEKKIEVKGTKKSDYFFNHSNLQTKTFFLVNEEANHLDSQDTFLKLTENSVSKDVKVEVQPLRSKDVAPTSSSIINVTKNNKGYRYLPDGLIFEKDVKLGITYDKELIPKGYSEKDIKIFFFDIESKEWKSIPTDSIDATKDQIISLTDHFTDYIAGIIKTPESPETNSFKPSSIQDIEIANPAAGINEIQAPEINQKGDASLQYPFEFPVSKNGTKPSLGLQYNNNGGNGWLGLGWDLSIPSIEVDTRWGVPRFALDKETEAYVMSGNELMLYQSADDNYLPHRKPLINRLSGEVQFVQSVEGGFSKITRLGNNSGTYSWVVQDKNGNKYYYGSNENSRLTNGAGTSGNIVRWMLDKVIDKNGNYTEYYYDLANFTQGPLNGGKQLYISKINYSINSSATNEIGYYEVNFFRKKIINSPSNLTRPDVSFSNRFGFKEVTFDLLDKVVISPYIKSQSEYFTNEYHFHYSKGQFDKTLLTKVVNTHTYENKVPVSYEHNFSYYNDVADGNLFENVEHHISTSNDYDGTFESLNIEPTLIGGGNGKFKSTFGGLSFGTVIPIFPLSYLPFSRSLTLGGSYTATTSENDTKIALIDIDGDGLVDKVFKKGRTAPDLYYRKNLGGSFSVLEYPLPRGFDLGKSQSESSAITGNANVFLISGAYSKTKSKSTNYKFFQDVNNDGLVDFIDNTNVFFTYIDPTTKLPVFTQDSSKTPNVIMKEEDVAPILNQLPDLDIKNDLMDIVRVWEAPVDGKINISGVISKQHVALENGVRYSIEHAKRNTFVINPFSENENSVQSIETNLEAANLTPVLQIFRRKIDYIKEPALMLTGNEVTNFNEITVKKGDQIFFRVGSSQIPTEDLQVSWNPRVDYTTTNFNSPNNYKKYSSSYDESFLLSEGYEYKITKPGIQYIQWDAFSINNTGTNAELSDNVQIKVTYYKYDTSVPNTQPTKKNPLNNTTNTTVYSYVIKADVNSSIPSSNLILNTSGIVESNPSTYQYVKIELVSDSEVNWSVLQNKFKPRIVNLQANETNFIAPLMSNYPNIHTNYYHSNFATLATNRTINVNHNFVLSGCNLNTCQDQYVYLIAKTPNGKLVKIGTRPFKYRFKINQYGNVIEKMQQDANGNYVVPSSYSLTTNLQNIYFEMYTDTKAMADRLVTFQNNNDFITLSTGVATKSSYVEGSALGNQGLYKVNIFSKENMKGFGPMFRNWGQFAYKGTQPGEIAQKINLKHLRFVGDLSGNAPDETILPGNQSMEDFFSNPEAAQQTVSPDGQTLNLDFMTTLIDSNSPFIHFTPLQTNMNNQSWSSHGKLYVTKTKIAPYTRFEDEDTVLPMIPQYHNSPFGAIGIRKEFSTEGTSYNIGVSTIYASLTSSFSKGRTKSVNDFRDINGDGYPDIIGNIVQLTSSRGGLSNRFVYKDLNYESTYDGFGLMASGSPGIPKKEEINTGKNKTTRIISMDNNGAASPSMGADGFRNIDEEDKILVDINGDGLPDFLHKNGLIELNYGNQFLGLSGSQWSTDFASKTTSLSFSINAGLNGIPTGFILSNSDLSIGGSLGISENQVNSTYLDINGDGLIDKITNDDRVFFNTGTSFASNSSTLPDKQTSIGANGGFNGAGTVSMNFPILFGIGPKFSIHLGGNRGENITLTRKSYIDFDGDGNLDLLTSNRDNDLSIRYSKINRTNMLKNVYRPLGAVITLDYSKTNTISNTPIGSTYKMPFKKWVLSSVQVFDGHVGDGEDIQKIVFEYNNGYKDRKKRTFLGFGEVKSHQMKKDNTVYRTSVKEYLINNIPDNNLFQRGDAPALRQYAFKHDLIEREYMIDENHRIHSEKIYEYGFYKPVYNQNTNYNTSSTNNAYYSDISVVLPLLKSVKTINTNFDETTTNGSFSQINKVNFNNYDRYGNVTKYNEELDNVNVEISYHSLANLNYFSAPRTHKVFVNGSLERESSTQLDQYGNVKAILRNLDSNTYSITEMDYDIYGNLIEIKLPAPEMNGGGERMIYNYTYNDYFNNRIVNVKNSHGYRSSTVYNSLGNPTLVKDINGNEFHYIYDALGRMTSFRGPYNNDWTIINEYNVVPGLKPYALTKHHLVNPLNLNEQSIVTTSTIIDGLGRVIQTKKELDKGDCNGYNAVVSGKIYYDEFGRSVASHLSQNAQYCNASPSESSMFFSNYTDLNHEDAEKTIVSYNYKDQPIFTKVLGLNATTQFTYAYGSDGFGTTRFLEKIRLPEGNTNVTYTDVKGRVTTTKQIGDEELVTKYYYDGLGQLLQVKDAENSSIFYKYDKFGRVTEKKHPDSGRILTTYDLAGRIEYVQTENLIATDQKIRYKYNIDQLTDIEYPSHSVHFKYGGNGEGNNSVGRLIYQNDLTGTQGFKYGALGEVIENERILHPAGSDYRYFKTNFTYDSWGKIYKIQYPDNENVLYNYNKVGQLINIVNTEGFVYLKDVKYNFFDQPTKIVYGNGTVNHQEYDITQRLRAQQVDSSEDGILMRNVYRYDKNQNIVEISNQHSLAQQMHIGGTYTKKYSYDLYNRLEFAQGTWIGFNEFHEYHLNMKYNSTHGIINKNQNHIYDDGNGPFISENFYENDYFYEAGTHKLERIKTNHRLHGDGEEGFKYDLNGNLIDTYSGYNSFFNEKRYIWDEQNRLMAVTDRNNASHYLYDASGERVFKREGDISSVEINGEEIYNIVNLEDYTMYPSSYLVVNKDQYTKHYYINSKRFASRIGKLSEVEYFKQPLQQYGFRQEDNSAKQKSITQLLTEDSQVQSITVNSTSQNNANCLTQINVLLNLYYPTTDPSRLHCREEILSIMNSNPSAPCVALELINQMTCIERDPVTGYPIGPGGVVYNPYTGYPIGQGPGESSGGGSGEGSNPTNPLEELSCMVQVQAYYDYNQIFFIKMLEGENLSQYEVEAAVCFRNLRNYIDHYSTLQGFSYCNVLTYIDTLTCKLGEDQEEEPQMPINPGDEQAPDNDHEDDWEDIPVEEPGEGVLIPEPLPIWWYHTDHLGSSSYITDSFGRPSHYYDQLPFGESMVEHNYSSYYNNGYKFNGKELDEATGMYYYGARYYDPRLSIFISVDPLAEKTMTPYQYVHNNPIMFTDPTGMSAESGNDDCDGPPWKTKQQPVDPHNKYNTTELQKWTRNGLVGIAKGYNLKKGGDLDKEKSDSKVTAPQLFYEWVMGTGKSERNFDENSVMGKQMLNTPEVTNAIESLFDNNKSFGDKKYTFARVLNDESQIAYPVTFMMDLDKNPARALHGSFSGSVSIESIKKTPLGVFYTLNILIKDNLSATSGTRMPPIFGGYSENNAIFNGPNPFGFNGNFRTIEVNYDIKTTIFKSK